MPTSPPVTTNAVVARQLRVLPLVGIVFFSVSGGPYGLEEAVSSSGPGMTMVMLLVVPVVFSLPCALVSAELGAALPLEGGYYYWVKAALGSFAAFCEGSWSWLNSFLDTALYPVIVADYAGRWIPAVARGRHALLSLGGGEFVVDAHWLLAVAIMVPLAVLNIRGSRLVGDSSLVMVVLVLAPFALLGVLGLVHLAEHGGWHLVVSPFTLPSQGVGSAFGAGLGVLVWNYIGWDAPSTVLGEVERPQRTYGRALAISLPLITLGYLVPMAAALGSGLHAGHPGRWGDGDLAAAASLLAGHWLDVVITIGAALANAGLFSSLLMSGSRVPRVLAGDGYLPAWIAVDHPRYGTPARAVVVSCCLFAVFATMDFTALVDADVLTNLAGILLEFAALLVLRAHRPLLRRPYRVPGGWPGALLVTAGPLVVTGWLFTATWTDEPSAFWTGVVVLAVGALAYGPCRRWIKRDRPDAPVDTAAVDLGVDDDGALARSLLVRVRARRGEPDVRTMAG